MQESVRGLSVEHALNGILRLTTLTNAIGRLEFQKVPHLLQCRLERQLKGSAAWPWTDETQLMLQLAIDYLQIGPAQYLLAPQHGHGVMAHATLVRRHIGL
jgi:hypothetical protein